MKQVKRRLILAALALFCLTATALAYDRIPDLNRRCSLTVESSYEGVVYDLYRVCDVDELAHFTPSGDFVPYGDRIEKLIEDRKWDDLIATLDVWLTDSPVRPYATASARYQENGKLRAVFTDLPVGLYLVRGRTLAIGDSYYSPVHFMVCLPNWEKPGEPGTSQDEGEWTYDVTAVNKGELVEKETVSRSVLKVWRGDGSAARPTEVTVELLRTDRKTGETVSAGTVTLNRWSGWSHLWKDLDNLKYIWTVREVDVPGDYEVTYHQEGANVVITNWYTPDVPKNDPDDPPVDPNNPGDPSNPNNPNNPNNPDNPKHDPDPNPPDPADPPEGPPNLPDEEIDDPNTPLTRPPEDEEDWDPNHDLDSDPEDEEDLDDDGPPLARLPQTGVLWWPVPFLAMGGMFLFVLGWALNRRAGRDEE